MEQLLQNIEDVRRRISAAAVKSGRSPGDVKLVAVSKTVGIEEVKQASQYGITDFGENRSRDLAARQELFPGARWHMVGQLQSNKVKEVVGRAYLIHSLDRWSLAEALNREAARQSVIVDALLEINVAGEKQKAGLGPEEARAFLESIYQLPQIRVTGLMTMAPASENPEDSRPVFKTLHTLFSSLKSLTAGGNVQMLHLSMGMSQDYEVAVQEGADLVRVGTAIFSK